MNHQRPNSAQIQINYIGSWWDFLNVSQLDFISANGWHPIVSSFASISAIPIGRVFPPWLHGPAIQTSGLGCTGQNPSLYSTLLSCTCTVLYYTVHCSIEYFSVLFYFVLYISILFRILHCIYCTVQLYLGSQGPPTIPTVGLTQP